VTEADFRPLLDAVPFETFTIHMNGKHQFEVSRPESVSFSPKGDCIYIHRPDGQLSCVLSMRHVADIEYVSTPIIRRKA
jgi:hypothetical protein